MEETNLGNNSLCFKSPEHPAHGLESEGIEIGSTEYKYECSKSEVSQCPAETGSNLGELDTQKVSANNFRRLSRYGKKIAMRNRGKKYLLRSSFNSSRVLRSMLKAANVTPPPENNNPENHVKGKKQIKRRKAQRVLNDEFAKIMRSVRYLLHRMSYEQSLIDAYAGEGWKGQSSEKIKPEMELQRAKSEILRCKLKIRNLFQQLDSSISEGKLDNSLFDSEGEICCEDIFCAKCRTKDVSIENDIILCDGICDRGFHQMCLNPPLLKDDIPPGDEGWLCPGCDCKVDCLDLINEVQGTDLSIEDEWEKVFPEAAAFASKNAQHDDLELPSDDSEDYDYDPDNLEADEELKEGSSSDESDFTSTSEDSGPLNNDLQYQNIGFPSDDSEDDDYDPDKPDLDDKAVEDSSSDESDFTSDTDDLNVPDNDTSGVKEASVSRESKYPRTFSHSGKESDTGVSNMSSVKSVLFPLESEMGQEIAVPLSGKRHRERLDYKELYDEAYGNNTSDSSDDEEWTEMSTPKKLDYDATQEDTEELMKNHVETIENQRTSKRIKGKQDMQDKYSVCAEMNESSQKTKTCPEMKTGHANHSVDKQSPAFARPDSNEKTTSRSSVKYGAAAFQKLQESFTENQYPSRETKESLAKELGMTAKQVSKWFDKARHSSRISAKAASPGRPSSASAISNGETSNSKSNIQKLQESFRENQYPSRETKESVARGLNMTIRQVSKWFENARHRFRVSAKEASPAGPCSISATGIDEAANSNINVQEAASSKRPSRAPRQKKPNGSRHVNTPGTRNRKRGGAKTKKATDASTSREILVMRELRKRRLSK